MKDKRTIELELELPGTPEQVWQAIATGPGISAWLAPSEIEERQGGAVAFHMAPDMDTKGQVTIWQPQQRFAYVENEWMPGAPPLTSDFVMEARPGGRSCRVRVSTSVAEATPELTETLRMMQQGWAWQFNLLRLYLTHFAGQRGAAVRVMGDASEPKPRAWLTLARKLGLSGAVEGERRSSPDGAPKLSGVVDRSPGLKTGPDDHDLILRLEEPAAGYAMVSVWAWGGPQVHAGVILCFFGPQAEATAAREEPIWKKWMAEQFPAAEPKRADGGAAHP